MEIENEIREKLKVLALNTRNILLKIIDVSQGGTSSIAIDLKDILSEDESTAQARRQAEELKQARLRREQQIDDTAKQISESFGDNLKLAIHEQINGFFAELVAKVNDVSEGFSAVDKQNSNLNEKLLELQQSLAAVNS